MSHGRNHFTICCWLTLVPCGTALAQTGDGYVGVFGDAAGTIRCTQAPPGVPTTLYVVAKTSGATANGITGAEFRIEFQHPSGYWLSYAAPTGSITLGDPLTSTGLNISFSSCRIPAAGVVSLGTVSVFNTGSGGQTSITVKRRNPPTNPNYPCALLTHCDAPAYTKSCNTAPPDSSCLTQKADGNDRGLSDDEYATFLDGYQQLAVEKFYEGYRRSEAGADFRGAESLIDTQDPFAVFTRTAMWVGIDNGNLAAPKWIQVGYDRRSGHVIEGYWEYVNNMGIAVGPVRAALPSLGEIKTYRVRKSGFDTEIYTAEMVRPGPAWSNFIGRGNFDESYFGAEVFNTSDCVPGCPNDKCRFVGATVYDVNESPSLVDFNFACRNMDETTANKTVTALGTFEMSQDTGSGCCF